MKIKFSKMRKIFAGFFILSLAMVSAAPAWANVGLTVNTKAMGSENLIWGNLTSGGTGKFITFTNGTDQFYIDSSGKVYSNSQYCNLAGTSCLNPANGLPAPVGTGNFLQTSGAAWVSQLIPAISSTYFTSLSGANLTSLPAGQLSGTIPAAVLGNSTVYIGTTGVVLNRASGALTLAGVTSALATALAANGTNCAANSYPLGVDASGNAESCGTTISGNAGTATALAAVPTQCAANNYATGIAASGNANCTATLAAGGLSGTIPAAVLGNSTVYIGTTGVALNRASGALTLAGVTSALATALAANGTNCAADSYPLGVDASGNAESCGTTISGNAGTATALAANGANCAAGNYPLGVNASGAVESCTAVPAGVSGGTANYVARFTGATTLSTGVIYDNATNVGIGTNAPGATYKVDIEDANMADYALYGSAGLGIWAHSSRNASGGIALTADCLGGTASNCDYAIKGLGGYQGAILGQTTNSAASAFGVGGISQYGPGVSGNGGTTGVQGSGPIGVYGGGTTYGVEGYTTAGSSYGVYGLNSGGSVGYGVYGAATGNSGTGVWGNVSGSNSYAVIANAATGNGSYNFYTNTNAPSVFLGNIGFGTSAPQTPIDVMGGYTNIQGVGINNAWVGNNFYYNGSNFVFETSGYASAGLYYEPSGMIDMRVSSASGTAGQTISWVTAFSISGAGSGTTGRVNIPNTLTIGSSATVNQAGDIGVSRNAAPASGVIYLGNNGGRYLFYDGSSYYLNGASLYVNSTLYPSDVRLKRDVTPLQDSLNKILALQGVNYKWNRQVLPDRDLPAGPQIGFIAQDVEKIIPEVVSTDGSGYEAIDYSKITPVLAEAIKEQQKQIDELRAEVESLKK